MNKLVPWVKFDDNANQTQPEYKIVRPLSQSKVHPYTLEDSCYAWRTSLAGLFSVFAHLAIC